MPYKGVTNCKYKLNIYFDIQKEIKYFIAALKKLGEEEIGMKLFLADGYEKDEDDILNSSVTRGETLIMSSVPPKPEPKTETNRGKWK